MLLSDVCHFVSTRFTNTFLPALVAQSDGRLTGNQEVAGSSRIQQHSFVEIDHEIFSWSFSLFH